MVQQTMYPAQPDSPDFELAADISGSDTSLTFVDLTGILAAPNTLTIRQDDSDTTPETVYYATYVSGNTLTVTRGYGGTAAKTFTDGALACRAHTALDHNTIRSNILDLDSVVFHKTTDGEIYGLTLKATPAGTDVLMIEDSAGSTFDKKRIAISTLPFQTVLTNPVIGLATPFVSGDVITGTGTGTQVQDSGVLLSALATKSQIPSAVSGDVITGTGTGIQDSGTLLSALATKSQIPSAVSGDVITGTGTGIQDSGTLLSSLAPLSSPALTGTPTVPTAPNGTATTQAASTAFVQNTIAYLDPLLYKGVIDCSGNPNYPAGDAGYTYIISVSGKIGGASGKTALVGDMVICNHDGSPSGDEAAVGAYWNIITVNTGAVIGPASSTDGNMLVFDGVTGKIAKDGGVPVAQPSVLGTPTLTTYQDFLNGTGSGGRIYGGVITDAGSGLINISALKGFIVIADYSLGVDVPATIKFFDLDAQVNWGGSGTGTTLTTDSTNYIYVDYNSGTPIVKCTTDRSTIRETDQFTLGRAFKIDASTIEVLTSGVNLYDRVRLTHEKWIDTFGGLSYANGMAVSSTAGSGGTTPYLGPRPAFTAGIFYAGSNKVSISAVDCNAGGTFTEYYTTDGGTTWTTVTGKNQLDNLNYNNTASGLVELTANHYGVHWLYICPQGNMYVLLGQGDYTLAQAQAAEVPSIIPNYISQWCVLAAKIIVQKSSTTAYQIISAWTTAFPVTQPTDHNSLAGLQGGTTNEYYHLTAAQVGAWAAFSPSPTWGTADPTITTTVARYCRTGNTVTFNVSFVISNGNSASSLTMALPVAAPQTANYQFPLIAFKKITTGGSSIMSDPFAYIDYTLATPIIKFYQFGTLPSGYTAVLNISGSYEVA